MKNRNKFILLNIFFIVFCLCFSLTFTSANTFTSIDDNFAIVEKGWSILYSTDYNYFIHFDNQNERNTQICLLHNTATNIGQIIGDMKLFREEMQEIGVLHPQMKRINTTNYFGYCYNNQNHKFLKFGEHSTIVIYQEEPKVVYFDGDNNEVITEFILKKYNGTDYNLEPETIWIKTEEECSDMGKKGLCFGATDESMNETEINKFKYQINSTSLLTLKVIETENYSYPIFSTFYTLETWGEKQQTYNFEDVCMEEYSTCEWTIEGTTGEITFFSDKYIDPSIYTEGNGTETNPYQITNCQQLQAMNESLTSYYILMNDIDCEWNLFSSIRLGSIFSGSLEGQNYEIFNLNISHPSSSRVGLFSDFQGTITNLKITNARITADDNTGVLVGYMRGGTITNITITEGNILSLSTTGMTGGLVGRQLGGVIEQSSVKNTHVEATHTSASSIGGFAGLQSAGGNITSSSVLNSTIIGSGDSASNVGGFVGRGEGTLFRNYAMNVNVAGENTYTGGFAGYLTSSSRVSQSWSLGEVNSLGIYTGGFVGRLEGIVLNSYAKTDVKSTADNIGGFTGYMTSTSTLNNSYSTGLVNRTGAGSYAGGLVGRNVGGVINSSYYDTNTSGQSDTEKGTPKTTEEMMKEATFIGWDFTDIWFIIEDEIYPCLMGCPSPDITPPNYTIISPQNNTYFNQSEVNFSINVTDDYELANGTIYIYNESGDLIAVIEEDLEGKTGILSAIYNFFEGIYLWFARIYDSAGNFIETTMKKIIVDLSPPEMAYIPPTIQNGSIIPTNFTKINITAIDYNLSYIELNLYKNYTFLDSITSTTSPLYHLFEDLDDGETYSFNASSCDGSNRCSSLAMRTFHTDKTIIDKVVFFMELEQYPYLDLNVSYDFDAHLTLLNNPILDSDVEITITKGTYNETFSMIYNPSTKTYRVNLAFEQAGEYTFIAKSINAIYGENTISGTFKVEEPYYVKFRIYEIKDKTMPNYKNDFSYIIVYPRTIEQYHDDNFETFLYSLFFDKMFKEDVFHAKYENGEATIKLWGDSYRYNARLIDGIIGFESDFSPPQIYKSYGTNIYLGNYSFNQQNQSYDVYITQKDKNPYRWVFNAILIILIILSVLIAVFVFFMIPQYPLISIAVGIAFPFMFIVLRIVIWLWRGI